MSEPHTFDLVTTLDESARDMIHQSLRDFNNAASPAMLASRDPGQGRLPLDVYVRAADGQLLGGLISDTLWHWLLIQYLWLPDSLRGKGLGTELIQIALAEAAQRGCRRASVQTFSFQARGFYEKLGFRVIGVMEDYPPGHSFYTLQKDFQEQPPCAPFPQP